VDVVHVPYKGGGPAVAGAIAGQVHGVFSNILTSFPHVKSGKLKALAVTSAQRASVLPELPTVSESVPGYATTAWTGWLAPKGTPSRIVNFMSAELARVVKSPEIASQLTADGATPVGSTPERFRQHIAAEIAKFRRVVSEGGLHIE
jgi:tripartite-type tricarboxylate transporter receptor subunit TctC